MSKKIVLSADGATATVTDAVLLDVITTLVSPDSTVTGTYGLVQKIALFVGGMSVQAKRLKDSYNPFTSA